MRARGRAGRGAVGPGRSPPGCQCGRGAAAVPPGTARPQLRDGVRAEPGSDMSFIISVYPLEVTVLLVTGAGDTGRGLPWFRGWAGAPRSCTVLPGIRDPAGRSCH